MSWAFTQWWLCSFLYEHREHDWISFLRRYVDSVQDITGVCPDISDVSTSQITAKLDELRGEMETMRAEVELPSHV